MKRPSIVHIAVTRICSPKLFELYEFLFPMFVCNGLSVFGQRLELEVDKVDEFYRLLVS